MFFFLVMSELLFECYGVPAIGYGVDALFSFEHSCPNLSCGLIVSLGYNTTHVIPVLHGQVVAQHVRRINIGGYHMIGYLHRLLQLKYPVHSTAVTLSRAEWLLHNHCSVAIDYTEALRNWASLEFYEANVKKVQLSFNAPLASVSLSAEQKVEKKREMAKRLADINARKREEKLADDEGLVHKMLAIREMYEDGDHAEFEYSIKQMDIGSYEELEKQIQSTVAKIDRTRLKIAQQEFSSNQLTGVQTFPFEENRPASVPQPPADVNVHDWVVDTRQKRLRILERRNSRRQRKQDLAKRRTAAAQERMRVISHLAQKEKGTDDFGMRDEDWDVYKTISRETGDSDSEAEQERLIVCEDVLRHHDPEFEKIAHEVVSGGPVMPVSAGDAAELYQVSKSKSTFLCRKPIKTKANVLAILVPLIYLQENCMHITLVWYSQSSKVVRLVQFIVSSLRIHHIVLVQTERCGWNEGTSDHSLFRIQKVKRRACLLRIQENIKPKILCG